MVAKARKLSSGKWFVQIRRGGFDVPITMSTEELANKQAARIDQEITDGVFQKRVALASLKKVSDFLDDYEKEVLRTKGRDIDIVRLNHFRKSRFADLQAHLVTFVDIEEYIAQRRNGSLGQTDANTKAGKTGKPVGDGTIRREMSLLGGFFRFVIKKVKLIVSFDNPVKLADKPIKPSGRERRVIQEIIDPGTGKPVLDPETGNPLNELEVIMKYTGSSELTALLWIANASAMRRGEIVHTKVENLTFHEISGLPRFATLYIPRQNTKTKRARTVILLPEMMPVIDALVKDKQPSDLIFSGKPHSYTTAMRRARVRARAAYLELSEKYSKEPDPRAFVDLRIHDQRHEAASTFIEDDNLDAFEVAKLTGHDKQVGGLGELPVYTNLNARKLGEKIIRARLKLADPEVKKGDLSSRIQSLKGLLSDKLITKAEYQKRVNEILAEI